MPKLTFIDDAQQAPIIIVGAGRSGTKLLRGILASHPKTVCFPREINYIWRHGNAAFPNDALGPECARPEVVGYIRKRFEEQSTKHNGLRVVEKTCANVLRLDFVHAVFPEAYIIHIVRDGRAVAESARRRWQAPPDPLYLWEKARWVPPSDLPYYVLRFVRYQFGRFRSTDKAQGSWGPRFAGLDDLIRDKTLIEVCGLQWRACVLAAASAFEHLPPEQSITVRYEDLVGNPQAIVESIFARIHLSFPEECQDYVQREVDGEKVHSWQDHLSNEDLWLLGAHIEQELRRYGYKP